MANGRPSVATVLVVATAVVSQCQWDVAMFAMELDGGDRMLTCGLICEQFRGDVLLDGGRSLGFGSGVRGLRAVR
jgi:hypothetical protein